MPANKAYPHSRTVAIVVIPFLRTAVKPLFKHGTIADLWILAAKKAVSFGVRNAFFNGIFSGNGHNGIIGIKAAVGEQLHLFVVKAVRFTEFESGTCNIPQNGAIHKER